MLENKRFATSDGNYIVPGYLSMEERESLRNQIEKGELYIYCACRTDESLKYKISSDFKFYPAHHGYQHAPGCIRGMDIDQIRKDSGYLVNDENSTIMVYLKFNPATFSLPFAHKSNSKSVTLPDIEEERKDVNLSLSDFVRIVNRDAYCERAYQNKPALSRDYFLNYIKGRLKHVCLNKMQKPLMTYTLKEDLFQFFYAPFLGIEKKENGDRIAIKVITAAYQNKSYKTFIPTSLWDREAEKFFDRYGFNPESSNAYPLYAAGFLYRMKSHKDPDIEYTAVGRLHLFVVSESGIYCGSMEERETLNWVAEYYRMYPKERAVFITPPEEKNIVGIFEKPGFRRVVIVKEKTEDVFENAIVTTMAGIQSEMDIMKMLIKANEKRQMEMSEED